MANHHEGPADAPLARALAAAYKEMGKRGESMTPESLTEQLGALRDHPAGMYGPHDEGAVQFAIGHDTKNEKVTLDFGTAVAWVAMDPQQAVHLAEHLIKHAVKASRTPLTVAL